jgi:hypothetical protein
VPERSWSEGLEAGLDSHTRNAIAHRSPGSAIVPAVGEEAIRESNSPVAASPVQLAAALSERKALQPCFEGIAGAELVAAEALRAFIRERSGNQMALSRELDPADGHPRQRRKP